MRDCACEGWKPPAAEEAIAAWGLLDPETRREHGVIVTRAPIKRRTAGFTRR